MQTLLPMSGWLNQRRRQLWDAARSSTSLWHWVGGRGRVHTVAGARMYETLRYHTNEIHCGTNQASNHPFVQLASQYSRSREETLQAACIGVGQAVHCGGIADHRDNQRTLPCHPFAPAYFGQSSGSASKAPVNSTSPPIHFSPLTTSPHQHFQLPLHPEHPLPVFHS